MKSDGPIRVGVTGHRFLAEEDKLRQSVRAALDRILAAFPERRMVIVSPLAEGADRMVAREGVARGAALLVPLPLPPDTYLQDFEEGASRAEFRWLLSQAESVTTLPATRTRNEAYEQVGTYVLDMADILIAIYDGKPAQGRGGTADVVREALDRGMPVLHIKAGNRRRGTHEPTTLGDEQGELVVHNL